MKNPQSNDNEEFKEKKEQLEDPLKTDQNLEENREQLEKINNGMEVDEVDHPDVDQEEKNKIKREGND